MTLTLVQFNCVCTSGVFSQHVTPLSHLNCNVTNSFLAFGVVDPTWTQAFIYRLMDEILRIACKFYVNRGVAVLKKKKKGR